VKKALYGLKQAPRAWYERIDSYLMKLGFTRSNADPNLYFKVVQGKPLILVLYVDDLFLTGADPLIHQCKRELAAEFEMKDLGLMHYFLGPGGLAETWQDFPFSRKIHYEASGMMDCKSVSTSMELNFAGPVLLSIVNS
jgi:hypothetical protein